MKSKAAVLINKLIDNLIFYFEHPKLISKHFYLKNWCLYSLKLKAQSRYIRLKRLSKSAELLKATYMKIKQIAYEHGIL